MKWRFEARAETPRARGAPGVFDESRFGAHDRIAWPKGACSPPQPYVAFGGQLAVIADNQTLWVIDAEREGMLRVSVSGFELAPMSIGATAREVQIGVHDGLVAIPFSELAALSDDGSGEIALEERYRDRKPTKRVRAFVSWLMTGEALVNVQEDPVWQLRIPESLVRLTKRQEFELVDELWPRTFAYVEVEGERHTLYQPRETMHGTLSWRRVRAVDPAEGATRNITTIGTRPDAAQLLAQIAERPDDLDARAILIDLLGEAGEACAETFAMLGAGKKVGLARQKAALGPLGHFLRKLEFRGGLPWAASLTSEPPTTPAVVAAAIADVRFGMFETLRLGVGPRAVYEELITTRVLPGLRRIDVPSLPMLRELKKRRYTKLVQLWQVPVTGPATFVLLGDRAFASVTHVELRFDRKGLGKRLDACCDTAVLRGRHVTIDCDQFSANDVAERLFAAPLGCASLSIAGVTVDAAGVVTTAGEFLPIVKQRAVRARR